MKGVALATALSLACPLAGQSDGLFRDLTLEAALEKAREEGKIVFIDFFTTWCGPCKQLDKTTWKDDEVVAWLQEKTVPLKVDAESHVEMAGRYGVDAYPTLAFINTDGELMDSIVGYRDAEEFLDEAKATLAGRGALVRAKEEAEAAGDDPMVRSRYADELARKGRHAEALDEYLWCFDHGLEHGPAFYGVRLSFLLGSIVRLGQVYPPALDALRERRDAAAVRVLEEGDYWAVQDLAALSRELGEPEEALKVYDEIRTLPRTAGLLRQPLLEVVIESLLEARRYADVVEDMGDMLAYLDRHEAMQRQISLMRPEMDPATQEVLDLQHVNAMARYYEAFAGAGELETAAAIADHVLRLTNSPAALAALVTHAGRAGRDELIQPLTVKWAEARETDDK